ncbi:3021_t:CDS:2 [Paraglomus occultum]|uniref:Phospholipid-transporting ATPase n=1 Tax=Paraglomus occultum TaxID=144539 RepID=A0A9N8VMX2_9GLOM|nr:3021_t:CDS:2 [Paraglomus occultum]
MKIFGRKRAGNSDGGSGGSTDVRQNSTTSSTQTLPKRRVYVNTPLPPSEIDHNGDPIMYFVPNKIRTAKYTIFTFLPKNLYEQFRRVANMYFLFLVILQTFPSLSGDVSPVTAAAPLATIVMITGVKDAIEDWKRRQQDNALNRSLTTRLSDWQNVNVTDGGNSWKKRLYRAWTTISTLLSSMLGKADNQSDTNQRNSPGNSTFSGEQDRNLTKGIPKIVVGETPSSARWAEARWQDLKVGDIVKLKNDDDIPADMVILSTSEPDGLCYVETKNLDGETNLKVRHCVSSTSSFESEADYERATFYVESEPPHSNLYSYTGVLRWVDGNTVQSNDDSKVDPISINNVFLRGCVVRNTEWAIGLVIYTGTDTKIMLNSGDTPSKRSRIEIETNFHVTMNFIILFLMCLGSAIVDAVIFLPPVTSSDYFEPGDDEPGSAFLTFWASLILFQNIVPISLYVSIEMVKTVQAYFIHSDIEMYYEKLDLPCVPKTWNISDDLGQIEYIFSDKTGTLTQNVMEFKKCTINGVTYGLGETDATRGAKLQEKSDSESNANDEIDLENEKALMLAEMSKLYDNRYMSSNFTFIDSRVMVDLSSDTQQSRAIQDFFSALALCHTVLAERSDENNSFALEYKAQSPDEAALLGAARDVGFVFIDRVQDTMIIDVMGERKEFTLLHVLEFNSTRKRMSVIVRPPEGGVVLLCKGADSVIYERLEKGRQSKLREDTLADLEVFANEGLRTLCIAYRVVPEEEYNTWSKKYAEATSTVNDREEKIAEAYELIEHSLTLMGGTAIEDRLQEGVPNCIATLSTAGIKIWVLTGDKTETAINIGFACNLLQRDMLLIIVHATDKENTEKQLKESLQKFFGSGSDGSSQKHALVIDGETLKHALDESLSPLLLDLGKRCESVLCCRVSPLQKAKVVSLVKNGLNVMTLSIGDGANDVSMIQEANVGIGIAGEEGRQAVMAADYAFAQFRFLTKLLLVHGRWSYIRIAEMISCFFYKNIVWTFAMFWYQIWAGFSAQYLYDYTYIMLYNLAFTAIPIMYLGAFDQDVNSKTSLEHPQLYKRGILQQDFTRKKFWLYVLDSIYQSLICYFIPFGFLLNGSSHENGLTSNSLEDLGTVVAGAVVVTTNLYVGLNTMNWTWMAFVVIGLSILSFYAWVELYAIWSSIGFFRVDEILFTQVDFWLSIILATLLSLLPRYLVKFIYQTYHPMDADIIRGQIHAKKKVKKPKSVFIEEDQMPITSTRKSSFENETAVSSTILPTDVGSEVSFTDSSNTYPPEQGTVRKILSLSKLPSFKLKSKNQRKPSVRSVDQLMYMSTGRRESFTGFAFSGEESAFETFRRSIYKPIQSRQKLQRAHSIATTSSRRQTFLSTLSISRSRTLPTTLFRRRQSRDPSPSLSINNSIRDRDDRQMDAAEPSEEVELSVISRSQS